LFLLIARQQARLVDEGLRKELTVLGIATEVEMNTTQEVERVFRQHNAMVYRAAFRVTGNHDDAEDVLQTVFLRWIRREGQADHVDNVESYLRRSAVNAAIDLIRSRQNKTVSLDDVAPLLAETPSQNPDSVRASNEIRDWLRSAIARLHPNAAEMFTLRFFEGRENHEIAQIIGTTPGTVAVTIHRTRDRIQREFRQFMGGRQ
jgi:RNA polymerase sigma-70 factor (ECF subfamily)